MHYTLTVYREDDTTPWFEVGTDPSHPAPYLHEPGEIDAGEVDFLRGAATIGQVNLRVIDVQTGASQAERWLTERLGIPAGEEGEGHTALIGRRALLMRDANVVLDGVVYSVTLSDTFAGFTLELRDIRERERRAKLFTRSGTASVLPRGVVNGYGRLPSGGWLVPPTVPLRATFRRPGGLAVFLGYFDLRALWDGVPEYDPGATVPPELVLTSAMRAATSNRGPLGHCLDVAIWWRPAAGGPWTIVERPQAGGVWPYDELLSSAPARLRDAGGRNGTAVEAIHAISVSTLLSGPWPANGQSVDVMVVYIGPASREYPFHFEGTAGELLRNAYRGDYSATSPGIRYDEAAVLALTTPVRVRITEPVEDLRRWSEEHVYRALGAAPALDPQGRISPVRAALPDPDAVLPVIDDDSAQAIPGWEHRADSAVTAVRVTYPRDYRVPAEQDPTGERSAGDGIVSREVVVERRAPDWAIGLMGEQVHEIDGSIFRALGGPDGEPVTGDVTDETGAQIALQRAHETLDRWVFGGQVSSCRIRAADFPGLRVGDWVIDARSWRPNYRTHQRGGQTLAQVMAIRAADPAWLDVTLVDAGPAEQPVQPPTLGTLSVDDDGVVSVPVTAVPVDGEAAVYYAISATQPAPDSGLWTFLGRLSAPGTLQTPPLPAGVTVWVRARGEALGRRPSQYTTPVSIAIPSTPRVHGVRVGVVDGVATVAWTPNARTRGVRVFYAAHAPDVEPALIDSLDVAAAEGSVVLPIRIAVGQSVTVEVEPWTGWTGSAVTGTRGSRVRAAATYDRGAPAISPVLDEDHGRLYLHPYRNEFSGSVRYVVSPLAIPTLEEVRAGTVSAAERILVHTFSDTGQEQRVYVAVLPFGSADGTGAEGSMVVLAYTYRPGNDVPVVTWFPITPSEPDREAVRLVVNDDGDQVALYYRTYAKGSPPPAFTRIPAADFAPDPLVHDVEVSTPAEGAPNIVLEAYGVDDGGRRTARTIVIEFDHGEVPSGEFQLEVDEGGRVWCQINSLDPDTGSARVRVVKGSADTPAYESLTFTDDNNPSDGKVELARTVSAFADRIDTGLELAQGEAAYLVGRFFRTLSAAPAAQQASRASDELRVWRSRGGGGGGGPTEDNYVRLIGSQWIAGKGNAVMFQLQLETGPHTRSLLVEWSKTTAGGVAEPHPFRAFAYDLSAAEEGRRSTAVILQNSTGGGLHSFDLSDEAVEVSITPYTGDVVGGVPQGVAGQTVSYGFPVGKVQQVAPAMRAVASTTSQLIASDQLVAPAIGGLRIVAAANDVGIELDDKIHSLGSVSGTITPNFANGRVQEMTLAGNVTIANPLNVRPGATYILIIVQGSPARTVSWGSAYKWPSGSAPNLATGANTVHVVSLVVRSPSFLAAVAQRSFA